MPPVPDVSGRAMNIVLTDRVYMSHACLRLAIRAVVNGDPHDILARIGIEHHLRSLDDAVGLKVSGWSIAC